jgi:hypothetical protein
VVRLKRKHKKGRMTEMIGTSDLVMVHIDHIQEDRHLRRQSLKPDSFRDLRKKHGRAKARLIIKARRTHNV